MRVLGISIDPASGKPRLHGVIVSGAFSTPVLEDEFELRSVDTDASEQAVDLARLLQAKLPGMTFDEAILRTAAPPPVARRLKAQFSRAHAEGAVMFVLREHTMSPITAADPQALAKARGVKKETLVGIAKGLLTSKQDAAIAAVSGLPHA